MIFDFSHYRTFLRDTFPQKGLHRGQRTKLAKHLNCQPSFLSLVITERAHLSPEALCSVSDYLQFSEDERDYLFMIYQHERAGSPNLKKYYKKQIDKLQSGRAEVQSRVRDETELPRDIQAQYYSQWYYSAIHTAVLVANFRTPEMLSQHFGLDIRILKDALQFLETWGLVQHQHNTYSSGVTRLHLAKSSPFIFQHHKNWCLEVIKSMERNQDEHLHYSGVITGYRSKVVGINFPCFQIGTCLYKSA